MVSVVARRGAGMGEVSDIGPLDLNPPHAPLHASRYKENLSFRPMLARKIEALALYHTAQP